MFQDLPLLKVAKKISKIVEKHKAWMPKHMSFADASANIFGQIIRSYCQQFSNPVDIMDFVHDIEVTLKGIELNLEWYSRIPNLSTAIHKERKFQKDFKKYIREERPYGRIPYLEQLLCLHKANKS